MEEPLRESFMKLWMLLQFGIYQLFAEKGIAEAYMTIKDDLQDIPFNEWDKEQMRRYIKPTHRLMVEVY